MSICFFNIKVILLVTLYCLIEYHVKHKFKTKYKYELLTI